MGRRIIDRTGYKFGRLTVLKRGKDKTYSNTRKFTTWLCLCDCGKMVEISVGHLKDTKSCGCKQLEKVTKHGLSTHKLYYVWRNMIKRCYEPKNKYFKNYGGRNIKICKTWLDDFMYFYRWALSNGWSKKLEIDRIDNNGDYAPENCRFVNHRENGLNSRPLQNNNISGFAGVSCRKDNNKWRAYINIYGKQINIGSFKNRINAVQARNDYIIKNSLQHEYKIQSLEV